MAQKKEKIVIDKPTVVEPTAEVEELDAKEEAPKAKIEEAKEVKEEKKEKKEGLVKGYVDVKATVPFFDMAVRTHREIGDVWHVTAARADMLRNCGYVAVL